MTLLLSMLPLYLFGNLHCMGMCGPLVMMIGQHRYRYLYFLGRTASFTLAGFIAGGAGAVLTIVLKAYHLSALVSLCFGLLIFCVGLFSLMRWKMPGNVWVAKQLAPMNHTLSLLLLRDQPWSTFLFGFFTLALPCGQTMIVFSALAVFGDPWVGLVNGFAFALLTSPALLASMQAHNLFKRFKNHYDILLGISALIIGILAICRGLADFELIPHLILNPQHASHYHLVIY